MIYEYQIRILVDEAHQATLDGDKSLDGRAHFLDRLHLRMLRGGQASPAVLQEVLDITLGVGGDWDASAQAVFDELWEVAHGRLHLAVPIS